MIPRPQSVENYRSDVIPDESTIHSDGGVISMIGAAFGPDNVTLEQSGGKQQIKDGGVSHVKLAGGFSKITVVDGSASGVALTIPGAVAGDELVSVLCLIAKANIATMADRTADYSTFSAGTLLKTGTNNDSSNQMIVFWNDLT